MNDRPAFAAELEPCSCADCNRVAAANHGARQLRARLMTESEARTGTAVQPSESTS